MRKLVTAITVLTLAGTGVQAWADEDDDASGDDSSKIEICHKGKREISVSESALEAHLNHGDVLGDCVDQPSPLPEPLPGEGKESGVVMMRCEAITGNGVVVVSASSSVILDGAVILPIPPAGDPDCAQALSGLLDAGFNLKSVKGGSAESGLEGDDSLHLYSDYLLIR